jgi:general secretion pathway protein D
MILRIKIYGRLALLLCLGLSSTVAVRAQTSSGRSSTGGGGFNGGGGGNGGQFRSSSFGSGGLGGASSSAYPSSTEIGNVTVSVDPETKRVFFITDADTAASVSNVIANLDKPKPQVLIKVVFLEVQHDNALDFGVEGSYTHNFGAPFASSIMSNLAGGFTTNLISPNYNVGNNFGLAGLGTTGQQIGQTTMPTGAGLYSVVGSDYNATIRAIASAQKVDVISRPSIMVRNNQPATITVGQSVPLVTGVTVNALTGSPLSTIAYQNVGVILQVTPFITPDGLVEMILSPQISDLSSQSVQVSTNVFAPVIDLRSASTVVVTPDGQTVIIGGLMENDKTTIDSKIPILGDIPLLGYLFKHHQKAVTKKELLIFVTPHVVITAPQMAQVTHNESGKAELAPKAFDEQELNKFFDTLPLKPSSGSSKH